MSAQLAAASLINFPSAEEPTKRPRPKLERHARRCLVCHHQDRLEIEDDFLHWRASTEIASDYGLPDRRAVYRHARATGLYRRRMRNMRVASSYIVQHADRVTPNANQVLDAVRACSLIDATGTWHEPIRHVIVEHINAPHPTHDSAAESTLTTPSETDISNVYSVQLESAATPTKQTLPTTSNVYSSDDLRYIKSGKKSVASAALRRIRGFMKFFLAALLILLYSSMSGAASPAHDTIDGSAVMAKARALEDLRSAGMSPWMMRAKFTVDAGHGVQEGEYAKNWWSPDRWQETLKAGDFARGREGVKDGYWQSRLAEFQPQAIFDLDAAINPSLVLQLLPDERVMKTSVDKNHGDPLTCVEVGKKDVMRALCFDAPGRLVRADIHWPLVASGGFTIDYSDFQTLGDKQFPAKIKITRKKEVNTEISITKLSALSAPAPTDVSKGSNSEFWAWCDEIAAPVVDHQVVPKYPDSAKSNHEQGSVTIYAHIEADGRVTHAQLLSGPSTAIEQSALAAVSQWTYKPATCGLGGGWRAQSAGDLHGGNMRRTFR